jgi:hypothetical protein
MAKKKNESNRARKIRRGVVGKYKVDTTNSKKRGGGDGSKKGTKRSGRFAGMTTEEIRDFRAKKKAQRDTTTTTTDTTTEDFEMPDFEGMFAAQADLYTGKLDELREQQRLEAEKYRREQAAAQRQFELDQRTMLGNEARAGQQTEYKFGSISGRKRGGTFGFRRRKRRLMGGIGSAVSAGSGGGTLNV